MEEKKEKKITPLRARDILFINEYFKSKFNSTEAYRVAFNYKGKNADKLGSTKRLHPAIAAAIDERLAAVIGDAEDNANMILLELFDMIKADKNDSVYTPSVRLKAIELLQKQLGLQKQKLDAKIEQVVFENEDDLED